MAGAVVGGAGAEESRRLERVCVSQGAQIKVIMGMQACGVCACVVHSQRAAAALHSPALLALLLR